MAAKRTTARAKAGRLQRQTAEMNTQLVIAAMRQHKQVETAKKRLKSLTREVTHISEREQRRFGQELHDDLAQALTGANYLLKVLTDKAAQDAPGMARELRRLAGIVQTCNYTARKLANGLCPVELERHGLASALRELCGTTTNLFGLHCKARVEPALPKLLTQPALQLYRIAQEALNNAAKHAAAKHAVLALTRSNGEIVLTVTDNGRGLPEDFDKVQGMGQKIMHYRAATIGAVLDVRNHPGGGVRVTCTLPVISSLVEKK